MARINRTERLLNERQAELERELAVIRDLRARLAAQPKRVRGKAKGATPSAVVAASLNKQVDAA